MGKNLGNGNFLEFLTFSISGPSASIAKEDQPVQLKKLDARYGESESEEVVGYPVFLEQVPYSNASCEHQTEDGVQIEAVVDHQVCVVLLHVPPHVHFVSFSVALVQ